jgi:uncharacterized UBP type Zn finger protein
MARARQSAAQRERIAVAKRISKLWTARITRQSRLPRGLRNGGNTCYRNSVLQTLLHLPKFVNWIMQHNEHGQKWPCRPTDPNQSLPPRWVGEPAIKAMGLEATGCVPCLFKRLVVCYWGNDHIKNNGELDALCVKNMCWYRLHRLAERWFYRDPPDIDEILNSEENRFKTEAQKTVIKQRLRAGHMHGQQDADEYMRFILDGIENTYNDT